VLFVECVGKPIDAISISAVSPPLDKFEVYISPVYLVK